MAEALDRKLNPMVSRDPGQTVERGFCLPQ
jgi:hypothetical protein